MGRDRIRVDGILYESVRRKVDGWDVEVDGDVVSARSTIAPSVPAVGDALCEVRVEPVGDRASVTFTVEDNVLSEVMTGDLGGESPEDFVRGRLDRFRRAFVRVLDDCAENYLVLTALVGSPGYASAISRDFSRYFGKYLSGSVR